MEGIPIPNNVDDITPAWFSKVFPGLRVKPGTFQLIPNAQEGIGFLSILARVEFQAKEPLSGRTQFNLIVKLIPESSTSCIDWARDIVMTEKLDQVEIHTYTTFLPDLVREVPQLAPHICDFHFAGIQEARPGDGVPYASVIVMEDLKPQGYTTSLINQVFPETEFLTGIHFLAAFHVAGRCLERRVGVSLREHYAWFPDWLNSKEVPDPATKAPGVFTFFKDGFPKLYNFLKNNSRLELIPIFERIEQEAVGIFHGVLAEGQKEACGIHGDLWSHNILINQDKTKPMKVIDWQLVAYADSAFDLVLYTLTTLPIESLNAEGISKAVRAYFEKYEELCQEKSLPTGRTLEDFEKFFNTYGLAYVLICYVISVEPFNNVVGAAKKVVHGLELLVDLKVTDFMLSLV